MCWCDPNLRDGCCGKLGCFPKEAGLADMLRHITASNPSTVPELPKGITVCMALDEATEFTRLWKETEGRPTEPPVTLMGMEIRVSFAVPPNTVFIKNAAGATVGMVTNISLNGELA